MSVNTVDSARPCFRLNVMSNTPDIFRDACVMCVSHIKVEDKMTPRGLDRDTLSMSTLFNLNTG